MSTLQEQLDRLIKQKGEHDPLVQALRNQILAERTGKTFRELYTGVAPAATKKPVEAGLAPLPLRGRSPRGFRVDGELLPAFHRVMRGLTSKRKTKLFYEAVADLSAGVDESVIADVGDRVGDGLPLYYIRTYISDQAMLDMLGLEEDQLYRITKAEKVSFARERLETLQSETDADQCPGFWLVPVTDDQSIVYLGYSITGYSFSGIEWKDEGVFISEEDFTKHICCHRKMLFDGRICVQGNMTPVDQLSDSTLMRLLWGR